MLRIWDYGVYYVNPYSPSCGGGGGAVRLLSGSKWLGHQPIGCTYGAKYTYNAEGERLPQEEKVEKGGGGLDIKPHIMFIIYAEQKSDFNGQSPG